MTNCPMESVEEYDDINTKNEYKVALEAGLSPQEAMEVCYRHSRDNSRTPMQWTDGANAGFTTGKPWLKVNPNYVSVNVASEEKREDSLLNYYKKLIALRKSPEYREVLTYGDFVPVFATEDHILAYSRVLEGNQVQVLANFGQQAAQLHSDDFHDCKLLLSNGSFDADGDTITLQSGQVVVVDTGKE